MFTDQLAVCLENPSTFDLNDHVHLRKHLHPLGEPLQNEANGSLIMPVPLKQIIVQKLVELIDLVLRDTQHLGVDVDVEDVGIHAEHLSDAVQVPSPQFGSLTPLD